jgi:delta 1-pyrroline-5-carboxylate dehydrogenase
MRITQEEIFGPVLCLMRASSFDEAIESANKIEYGLVASVYTRDSRKAFEFIKNVQAGVVKINKPTTGLAIHVPFGGFKRSSNGLFKEQGGSYNRFLHKDKNRIFQLLRTLASKVKSSGGTIPAPVSSTVPGAMLLYLFRKPTSSSIFLLMFEVFVDSL